MTKTRWPVLLGVLMLAALPVTAEAATPTPTPGKTTTTRPTYRYTPPDVRGDRKRAMERAGQYLDKIAAGLGEPGVLVDSSVTKLSAAEAARLNAAAKSAAAPMRIAVIPASAINLDSGGFSYSTQLAWTGEEIADQLYDRVGVEGVYAVLVDARSESAGRGFHAVQRADKGPTYHVGDAVDQAVDCCAPDYERMLERFIQRGQVIDKPFYVDAAPWAGGAAGLAGLWWGLTTLSARRARRAEEKQHLEISRPLLNEEIIALSQQVSALPTTPDPQQSKLSKDVLDTVEKARHRLDAAKGDKDTEAVATLLGSARYGLLCLDALRAGRPVPEPTAPCFFDPRHGPSTGSANWTPEGGSQRAVDVCAACAARLAANQQPDIRMVTVRDRARPYWTLGEDLASYIDGYWSSGDGRRWWFPDEDARRAGNEMRARWASRRAGARLGRAASNVGTSLSNWSSSSGSDYDSDGGGWGSGSSRRRSYSSRTRSSGGGSSRRSSRRSGGSRGF
ncbi:hypothetical protein BWI15_14845 [Kribbella sp. ALI-6-A]|uniref:hypothetical protein n=1 Tax=Kribbella sp. ALI-6-A TaxID=1933817 RepID=UPI00097C8AE7|nr:hypothetical protein [Kribbella sp. ALI-6-A]ONI71458.1 hypothetical protein BWI15_14845 [Kribbella sp. ALI-6-A]